MSQALYCTGSMERSNGQNQTFSCYTFRCYTHVAIWNFSSSRLWRGGCYDVAGRLDHHYYSLNIRRCVWIIASRSFIQIPNTMPSLIDMMREKTWWLTLTYRIHCIHVTLLNFPKICATSTTLVINLSYYILTRSDLSNCNQNETSKDLPEFSRLATEITFACPCFVELRYGVTSLIEIKLGILCLAAANLYTSITLSEIDALCWYNK